MSVCVATSGRFVRCVSRAWRAGEDWEMICVVGLVCYEDVSGLR
jgi:hypothetical protein